jgi:hypothetical protein
MEHKHKNFTVIDWDIAGYIRRKARLITDNKRKPTYSDILIIFYIKGFGDKGYFGSQANLGRVLGMTQEQVSRSLKILYDTVHIETNHPILIKTEYCIYFNNQFFFDYYGNKLPYAPI